MTDQKSESTNKIFPSGTLFLHKGVNSCFMILCWKETGNPNEPYTAKLLHSSGEVVTIKGSTLEIYLRTNWPNIKIISPEGIEQ